MLDKHDLDSGHAEGVVVRTLLPAQRGLSMLNPVLAVLAGAALLCCSWWMLDRNTADREGEVSLELVALAPNGNAAPVTVLETGTTEEPGVVVAQFTDARRFVVPAQTSSCAGLPPIGRSLKPAPYWVATNLVDGTSVCRLSGRWQLADLIGQVGGDLTVSEFQGRLHLEYGPVAQAASFPIVDFDLRVRFPAEVDSADRAASVSGNSAHWAGAEALRSGAPLTASSPVLPLARASAPWAVGALALLIIVAGIFWPYALPRQPATRFERAVDEEILPETPLPSDAKPARTGEPPHVGPDPDSPWRPPD